jgi:hypothetical protein
VTILFPSDLQAQEAESAPSLSHINYKTADSSLKRNLLARELGNFFEREARDEPELPVIRREEKFKQARHFGITVLPASEVQKKKRLRKTHF